MPRRDSIVEELYEDISVLENINDEINLKYEVLQSVLEEIKIRLSDALNECVGVLERLEE